MAGLTLDRVTRRFGPAVAVDGVSLEVRDGEFVALLGPSGCGKTTLLRLVAGFEAPDDGVIAIGGETVARPGAVVPPERRGLGMVFQSYALWPHMSVADNVAYALKVRRLPAAERTARVARALELVGLAGLAGRRPQQLSGGQRQRVALARCLAMRPRVVLLDEPLANLDAHLRDAMQEEFRRVHRETGATILYVTHDQAEAMALADRVAVMDRGRLEQVATPRDLYRAPATAMVAGFVGRGMLVPVTVRSGAGAGRVAVGLWGHGAVVRGDGCPGESRRLCLRARDLDLAPADGEGVLAARVVGIAFQGAVSRVTLAAGPSGAELHLDCEGEPPPPGVAVGVRVRDGWLLPEG
ncbi:ABC transporter ATP-binding protein [Azospirillum halopraeferens]|uniref:ABC transporter ATP-binding protein n=1 Tax=Azospirillum halopraeferens TaxID=34010 RepID=UPI0004002123|nr:ABC transporter ATP-binding protein [Azospirillum halopraeferens]